MFIAVRGRSGAVAFVACAAAASTGRWCSLMRTLSLDSGKDRRVSKRCTVSTYCFLSCWESGRTVCRPDTGLGAGRWVASNAGSASADRRTTPATRCVCRGESTERAPARSCFIARGSWQWSFVENRQAEVRGMGRVMKHLESTGPSVPSASQRRIQPQVACVPREGAATYLYP